MTDFAPLLRFGLAPRHASNGQRLARPLALLACATLPVWMAMALGSFSAPALAQFREAPAAAPRIPTARNFSTELKISGTPTTADYIVAVVTQEVVTHTDVDKRVQRIQDTAQQGTKLPPPEEMRQQVLNLLIDEKVQISHAKSIGMDISDAEVDATIEGIAAQNKMSLQDLKARMKADGLEFGRYRASMKEQLLLQRLREREVTPRIRISDQDIDTFLKEDPAAQPEELLNVAHILIAIPEGTKPPAMMALQAKAQELRNRALKGEDFAKLARDNSEDDRTRANGGEVGLREPNRLPPVFVATTTKLKEGEITPVVRSSAGFHIIKLLKRDTVQAGGYTQQRARHILLRTSPQAPTSELIQRLQGIRKQILDGQASFAQMARQYSEDGSASRGGDLGFVGPGQFVPEFEKAMSALQPGQMSEPVVSRFGVHLIQLLERKEVQLNDAQKREAARNILRERKFDEAYEEWSRELRAAAWIENRDAP